LFPFATITIIESWFVHAFNFSFFTCWLVELK
jgi:hypothetical protein